MTTVSTSRRQGINSSAAIKVPCRAATTANITLSGEQTIDAIACVTGDRVLVKNQTTAANNGIYEVNTSTWGRAPDFDGANDVVTGTIIYINSGIVNGGYYYIVTNTGTITIGTTSLTFQQSTIIPGIASSTTTTAITIDSSNNVTLAANLSASSNTTNFGTGTAATNARLTVNGGANSSVGAQIKLQRGGTSSGYLMTDAEWVGANSANVALVAETGNGIKFFTNGSATPKAIIDSSGNLLVGKLATGFSTVGTEIRADNSVYITNTTGTTGLSINRTSSDGSLIDFHRDASVVGTISVAGGVVTYGSFAGKHWSQLIDNATPEIKIGTVVSTIDVMCGWGSEQNIQLAKFEISKIVNDPRVYGVFCNWDKDGDAEIIALGAFVIRVTGPCNGGQLLVSKGDGTAMAQSDDIIRNKTIGKVTKGFPAAKEEDENLVPVVLYCG